MDRTGVALIERAAERVKAGRLVMTLGVWVAVIGTAAGAFVRVPVPGSPVPVTLQTYFVLIAGALLGWKLGSLSQFIYVVLGGIGLPLFAGGATGGLYLFGPTGGYLLGFFIAALLIGRVMSVESPSTLRAALAMTAGSLVIYLFGAAHLAFGWGLGVERAILGGVLPFLAGDAVKIVAAVGTWRACRYLLDRTKAL